MPINLVDGLRSRGHNVTLFDMYARPQAIASLIILLKQLFVCFLLRSNLGIAEVQAVMRSPNGWYYGQCM